eukprot:680910-Amorphochlora_amoeboformis.AAC.1
MGKTPLINAAENGHIVRHTYLANQLDVSLEIYETLRISRNLSNSRCLSRDLMTLSLDLSESLEISRTLDVSRET